MIITAKTKLKDMSKIQHIATVANVDLLKECSKFDMPEKVCGIEPMRYSKITMLQQSWIWDIKDSKDLLIAYAEIFFGIKKNVEKWLLNCPLIDFYKCVSHFSEMSEKYANDLSNIHIDLTEEEKRAGFGDASPDGTTSLVYSMSCKKNISMEQAWNYPAIEYIYTFKTEAETSNKQRRYNKIISEKK